MEQAAMQWLIQGRTKKPFDPLIGETYELVTDKFSFYSENCSQFPPICAYSLKGEGFKISGWSNTNLSFNATKITVTDSNHFLRDLILPNGEEESYISDHPKMVIGNIAIQSKMYMEAADDIVITNKNSGVTCDLKFHPRTWTSKSFTNRIEGMVKDAEGADKIRIEGYYTSEITATNVESGEKWTVFKAPQPGVDD